MVRNSYRRKLTFPGGYVRPNEERREAAARELEEEVGIVVKPTRLTHEYHGTHDFENRKDTLDIFSKKPDDVFLYCDFTWLQHASIKKLGSVENVKHIEMKWLNDGSMIPKDVNIVTDLAVHPISILTFFLVKSMDIINTINVVYANKNSVLINGNSKKGITFNIEVSNSSKKKMRNVSIYSIENVYRWNSCEQFHIENIGEVQKTDAIEENIRHFFCKNSIGYPLDIARTLETVNKLFSGFDH